MDGILMLNDLSLNKKGIVIQGWTWDFFKTNEIKFLRYATFVFDVYLFSGYHGPPWEREKLDGFIFSNL